MRRLMVLAACCLATVVAIGQAAQQEGQKQAGPAASSRAGDEAAIHKLVEDFTTAFNRADTNAMIPLFAEEARITTSDGRVVEGREAIRDLFEKSFRDNPGQAIVVKSESLRFLGDAAAIEEGVSLIFDAAIEDGEAGSREATPYSATYIKRDGKWLQDAIHDYPPASAYARANSLHEHLDELDWLVGEWIDESDEAEVHIDTKWSESRTYLLRSFRVKYHGEEMMAGVQRIGWDARLGQIRAWTFDDDGGFSEAFWSRDGESWIIKSMGTLNDGRATSATHTLTRVNSDTIQWSSADRTIGDDVIRDLEKVTIVRVPPRPYSASRSKSNDPAAQPQQAERQ